MTEKKLSRRDSIKILGTAIGASALANLPKKWSKPELTGSSLPVHAQTSCSIVRTAIVNVPASISIFSYNLDTPITQANFDACLLTQLTISWTGAPTPGPVAFSVGPNPGLFVNSGIPSPYIYPGVIDQNLWFLPIDFLEVNNLTGVAWNAGTVTITFS